MKQAKDGGQDQPAIVSKKDIAARLGVSDRSAADVISAPWFPKPMVLGPRVLRWRWAEIEQALATQAPRQTERAEPARLKAAREQRVEAARQANVA